MESPEEPPTLVLEPTGELVVEEQATAHDDEVDVDGIVRQLEEWMA